ncbi:enolase [Vairimorpha necatrix]|uniref:phosphopyruvate hydratase n=1 Tax=Vairimorpha necatrix TaxID=6039 RepID=A0AAX4JE75_9MICR
MDIKDLKFKSRTILDSRGNPTSEVDIIYKNNIFRSSCPAGASVGSNECIVLKDNRIKYRGKSIDDIHQIIKNVIVPKLMETTVNLLDSLKNDEIMLEIDKSNNKQNIGVNSILPLSLSLCKLAAHLNNLQLFEYIAQINGNVANMAVPHFNILNGGMHSGNNFSIQEIMIKFNAGDIEKNIEYGSVFYQELKNVIIRRYGSTYTSVGDEGGFAPPLKNVDEAMDLLKETGTLCGITDYKIAMDVAANSFYKDGKYDLNGIKMTSNELCEYYLHLIQKHPNIYSIEDPFSEDDTTGWEIFSKAAPSGLNIVGDDLTVTNINLVKQAGEKKLCNVLLVKPNQIGSVLETLNAVNIARKFGMKIMVSHRSGETEDTFISHLAVGIGADYIKSGAPCRGERVSKYNELIRINEHLKK